MRPERAAGIVRQWVRFYTRNLPPELAARRRGELAADLHDHIAFERHHRAAETRISLGVLSRTARGMAADLAWRRQAQPSKGGLLKLFVTGLGIALGLAVLALMLDSGLVVLASVGVLIATGLGVFILGLRSARQGAFVVPYFAIVVGGLTVAAMGCAAIFWGSRGDAPGLVLLGSALIGSVVVGSLALGIRTSQRT
jgi:hypothetical protein